MTKENDLGADAAAVDGSMATSAGPSATARHTEGPWRVDEENCGGGVNIRDAKNRRMAHTSRVGNINGKFLKPEDCIEEPEARANAHLIAAAPELKTALINLKADVRGILGLDLPGLRSLYGNTNLAVLFQRVDEAEAAIAKAEGRQRHGDTSENSASTRRSEAP